MRRLLSHLPLLLAITILTGCSLKPTSKPVKISDARQVAGSYSLRGTNPDNAGIYIGTVTVRHDGGTELNVTQLIQGMSWHGTGHIDSEGRLFVVFEENGVEGTWTLYDDGNLMGSWRELGQSGSGTEVWTRQ